MTITQPNLLQDIEPAGNRVVTVAPRLRPEPAAGAPMVRNGLLPIRVGTEVTLVSVDVVRATRGGLDAESVAGLVDCGRFRWVWDFSAVGARRRELRFLADEIVRGQPPQTEDAAIESALGGLTRRDHWRTAELEQRWVLSNATLLRLGTRGELEVEVRGRNKWITRTSLVALLRRRLARN